ncbi:MAG: hypothetical protein ACRDQ0_15250 [Pseudonocardia sp.]
MTRRRAAAHGTGNGRCPTCRALVLHQLVEVLTVTADPRPLTPAEQETLRGPNRLIWCAPPSRTGGPPRLRWIYRSHPPDCPHPHLADHHCPPADPTTLF